MSEKPTDLPPIQTVADQIRARGGILGSGLDGNGNPIPGSVADPTACFAKAPEPDPEPEHKTPPDVGQIWLDETGPTGPVRVTVLAEIPGEGTAPMRWLCHVHGPTASAEVEHTEAYFMQRGVRLWGRDMSPAGTFDGDTTNAALSGVGRAAAGMTQVGRSMVNLMGHMGLTLGEGATLTALAAHARSLTEARVMVADATSALESAESATASDLAHHPAAEGIRYIASRIEPVTLAEVAGHMGQMFDGPEVVQDFLDALQHLAAAHVITLRYTAKDPQGLSDVLASPGPRMGEFFTPARNGG